MTGSNFSYDITMDNDNVASGQYMSISANRLGVGESLTFDGSAEADGMFKVYSGAGDDFLLGGQRADIIWGGAGSDRIAGAAGADELHGGAGADIFAYWLASQSTTAARDHIVDFETGDLIDLSGIDAIAGSPAQDGFSFIGAAAFSNTAGELRVHRDGGFWYVDGDTNGDGTADLSIKVTADAGYGWSANDFLLSAGPPPDRDGARAPIDPLLTDGVHGWALARVQDDLGSVIDVVIAHHVSVPEIVAVGSVHDQVLDTLHHAADAFLL